MSNLWEFSTLLEVHDPEALRQAALAHRDAPADDELTNKGEVDIRACLVILLQPGALPGCGILESTAEGGQ